MLEIMPLYLLAVLALTFSPGPDMLFIIRQSMSLGRQAGLAATLGIGTGIFVHTCLVSLGLAALLVESEKALVIIQYVGGAYLFYLGGKSILSKEHLSLNALKKGKKQTYSFTKSYFQGLMVNLLNPKVILFFLAFLPQFVDVESSMSIGLQLFILGLIFNIVGTACDGLIGYFFSFAKNWLETHPNAFIWQQRVTGVLFIGIALHLVFMQT